ncbi:glutathione S-transferase family protein [Primorskyibacter sp. 2E107]|uniref:glutathione S-transferase family protein n=1 Tax=Primorskyibacter sp. 2E107 TaxID=3403458 RepID=UPI003AF425C3
MNDVTLFGLPPSTYVRTAAMVLDAKGVRHSVEFPDFRTGGYREIHPFGRIPALRHGDLVLYETLAIATYVDEAFEGPALQPGDAAGRARMMQWISAINDYVYASFVGGCIAERFVKPMRGMQTDEAVIKAATPTIAAHLGILDAALADTPFLAGDGLSLADFFLAPIMAYLENTPEGEALLPERGNLVAWSRQMASLPGYDRVNTMPVEA